MDGFKKFLLRGNLVDLAVAVVIGAAFGAIVSALVADFITPLIGAIIGKSSFAKLTFTVHKSQFFYGDFINKVIYFVIVAAVIYFLVIIPVGKLLEKFVPTPSEPTPVRDCTECMSSIPKAAKKCAFCSSVQKPVAAEA